MTARRQALIIAAALLAIAIGLSFGAAPTASAQSISVTAADPPSGEQGSLNLNVLINGRGFKNGAKAKFYKTGTTDPAGVNVKSTQFVSSSQLIATIDISDAAALALFDIQVANTDGRTGKGTELFNVVAKGNITPVYEAEFVTVKVDDPTWSPKIRGDGLGPYEAVVQAPYGSAAQGFTAYGFVVGASETDGRSIVFQFDDPYTTYQPPLRCKTWGSAELYERAYPPILLTADKVTVPRFTQMTMMYELTYDQALEKWVRIVKSVSRKGDVTYRFLDPFAMVPGQKSYAMFVIYFRVDGEQGNFYINFNDTFAGELVPLSNGRQNGGVVEVERDALGEAWSIRPIAANFPILGNPPTLIPRYQANYVLYDTPDLRGDPGGNCNFGDYLMKFELRITRKQ